jgi:hypothetical protein
LFSGVDFDTTVLTLVSPTYISGRVDFVRVLRHLHFRDNTNFCKANIYFRESNFRNCHRHLRSFSNFWVLNFLSQYSANYIEAKINLRL